LPRNQFCDEGGAAKATTTNSDYDMLLCKVDLNDFFMQKLVYKILEHFQ